METQERERSSENLCNFKYLSETMGGKKHLIKGIIDAFVTQLHDELKSINDAIDKKDYATIKSIAHTLKSSVSILGIVALAPVLQEIERLSAAAKDIDKIKGLNFKLNLICKKVFEEIEREIPNYS
jgi:HPt (histidine-containing phosphotransfer) domain-containing protein